MLASKDYSALTLEELVSEEKKMKSQKIFVGLFIGITMGIAVYGATHKSFMLPCILLILAFLMGKRHSQRLDLIQAEIGRRNEVR